MYLARKVALAKWGAVEGLSADQALRLAMESDLRSRNGELSLWLCSNGSEQQCEEVALALAAALDHFSGVQLVLLQDEQLAQLGITWISTKGATPIKALQDSHVTALGVKGETREALAREIHEAVARGDWRTFSRGAVKKLLVAAIAEGRLASSDLSDSVWKGIRTSVR